MNNYNSTLQTTFDNRRADDCADTGELTHCPDCNKQLVERFGQKQCPDQDVCGWQAKYLMCPCCKDNELIEQGSVMVCAQCHWSDDDYDW